MCAVRKPLVLQVRPTTFRIQLTAVVSTPRLTDAANSPGVDDAIVDAVPTSIKEGTSSEAILCYAALSDLLCGIRCNPHQGPCRAAACARCIDISNALQQFVWLTSISI